MEAASGAEEDGGSSGYERVIRPSYFFLPITQRAKLNLFGPAGEIPFFSYLIITSLLEPKVFSRHKP